MEKLKTYRVLLASFTAADLVALLLIAIMYKENVVHDSMALVIMAIVIIAIVLEANTLSNYPFHWIDNPRKLNLIMIVIAIVIPIIITLVKGEPVLKLYNNKLIIIGLLIADLAIGIKDLIRTYRSDYTEYDLESWTKKGQKEEEEE